MKTKPKMNLSFYQHLGRLFYAVAFIDKKVRKSEVEKLQEIVKTTWLSLDNEIDEFEEDVAYQIEIVFNWLEESFFTAEECYNDFESYYKSNKTLFTASIKAIITKTASAIANAYAGINKSELILTGKLSLLFRN